MKRLLIAIIDIDRKTEDAKSVVTKLKKHELTSDWQIDTLFLSSKKVSAFHLQVTEDASVGFCYKIGYQYALQHFYHQVIAIEVEHLSLFLSYFSTFLATLQPDKILLASRKGHGTSVSFQKRFFQTYIADYYTPIKFIATDWLRRIPFVYNSNTRFSDEINQQIILSKTNFQTISVESSLVLPPILLPSTRRLFYQAKLHTWGIFYRRKFDCVINNQHYSLKLGYPSSHTLTVNAIEAGKKVVDIGAGPYSIAPLLLEKGCEVTTVDMFDIPEEFKVTEHIIADMNENFNLPLRKYDYILFLDIIEHLYNPEEYLKKVSEQFGYQTQKVILTTGNIAFFPLRIMLLLGFFNYGKSGILDRTHTRLFTFRSFRRLIEDSNMKINKIKGVPAPFPKAIGDNFVSRLLLKANNFLIKISKSLFAYQIYVEAETQTSISYLINNHKKDVGIQAVNE